MFTLEVFTLLNVPKEWGQKKIPTLQKGLECRKLNIL